MWPTPEQARHGLDRRDSKLLENAIDFSGNLIDGAKAYTGLQFMLHTVVGSSFGIILSVLLGGALVLAMVQNLSLWVGPFFAALIFSLILGLVVGYCWYWIYKIKGKRTEMPTE